LLLGEAKEENAMFASMRKVSVLSMVGIFLVCCGYESVEVGEPEIEDPEIETTASALIGNDGGTLAVGTASLVVPAGALAEETEISVNVSADLAPRAFTAYSPVFRFGPSGQVFDRPVTVRLPYAGSDESATIFWTTTEGGAFMALPTRIEDGHAVAEITHFSDGFVGSGCEGDDCCDRANGELDVVLMVDNSNSMTEEQLALAEQLPRMARVLATGDLDGDGEQDFPALHSVRVGIVTPDMGSGEFEIMTCEEPGGDDGRLRSAGNADIEGCDMSYPRFAELDEEGGVSSVEEFVHHVECVAQAGIGGCGFEQQLESVLKAVTPSTSDIRFAGGDTGHGDGANAGFIRDESIVAYILLTDEGDCSVADTSLFNPARDDLGPLNTRCYQTPEMLRPADRYMDGLSALREDPDDVIFSLVAGVPVDLIADGEDTDFDAILSDERMDIRVDPSNPNELLPSCASRNGMAYPPRRMVEVAESFGDNGVLGSICQEDFRPVIGAILERVASRARGECTED